MRQVKCKEELILRGHKANGMIFLQVLSKEKLDDSVSPIAWSYTVEVINKNGLLDTGTINDGPELRFKFDTPIKEKK